MNLEIIMQDILNDSGKLIFLVLLLVIFIDVVVGVFLLIRTQKFMANSVVTKAKILSSGNNYYEIEYNDRLGRKINEKLYYSGKVKKLNDGEEIEIRYDKENPSKMKRNNKFQIFIIPFALLEGAFIFTILLTYFVYDGIAKIPF